MLSAGHKNAIPCNAKISLDTMIDLKVENCPRKGVVMFSLASYVPLHSTLYTSRIHYVPMCKYYLDWIMWTCKRSSWHKTYSGANVTWRWHSFLLLVFVFLLSTYCAGHLCPQGHLSYIYIYIYIRSICLRSESGHDSHAANISGMLGLKSRFGDKPVNFQALDIRM